MVPEKGPASGHLKRRRFPGATQSRFHNPTIISRPAMSVPLRAQSSTRCDPRAWTWFGGDWRGSGSLALYRKALWRADATSRAAIPQCDGGAQRQTPTGAWQPWEIAALAVTPAQLADAERLAWLSHSAKLTYRMWAKPGWAPPAREAEAARWERRLRDRGGSTLIAQEGERALGAVHLTDARRQRGEGQAIVARAHLSGLFVDPLRWGEGIGSCLTTPCWPKHASAATEASSCSRQRQTCVRGRSMTRAVGGSSTPTTVSTTDSASWAMSASWRMTPTARESLAITDTPGHSGGLRSGGACDTAVPSNARQKTGTETGLSS